MNKKWWLIASLLFVLAPGSVSAQRYSDANLPTKKYQGYPEGIPDKKWVSLFFDASRQYGRERASQWNHRYYSNGISLTTSGDVWGWVREDGDLEKHWLVKTSIRNCQVNSSSHSVIFLEYWQKGDLHRREHYSYVTYGWADSLGIQGICAKALVEYNKRI